ncbi:MAG: hypothetical protein KAI20_05840 [Thermoplasmatales archaeon]|nr:hypothetical protein [Thermoplasmatales archaeon]
MKKNENLYIKLGLEKDQSSNELVINIEFDNNAPNFSKDKDVISWRPSYEEWAFANEAFEILLNGQNNKHGKKQNFEQNESVDKEEFIAQDNEHEIVDKYLEKNKKI